MSNTMTVSDAAKTLRTMTASEREWVKALAENKQVAYQVAVPYVLSFRA